MKLGTPCPKHPDREMNSAYLGDCRACERAMVCRQHGVWGCADATCALISAALALEPHVNVHGFVSVFEATTALRAFRAAIDAYRAATGGEP
jgi:hypothetical protein